MNKRQLKKRDAKLYKAIWELNEFIVMDMELNIELSEESLLEAFKCVKEFGDAKKTFKAHRRMLAGNFKYS